MKNNIITQTVSEQLNMIELNNLSYAYNGFKLDIDLHIPAKEKLVIIGPSGAGKSTLLSLIAGFILPNVGKIVLDNQVIQMTPPGDRPISMLFQDHNLFNHLNLLQNVALGIKPSLKLSIEERKGVDIILTKVGLAGYANRYPDELSGGQRQRVSLARCLLQHRPILLLDEPFSALDQALRYEMLELVDEICNEFGLTLIMVSHYLDASLNYFSRAIVMDKGKIIFDNAPKKLYEAKFNSTAKLLGINQSEVGG